MKKFFSVSQYPGKTGEYYYNTFFKSLGLPYTYTALKCIDIKKTINELITIKASGISVSMPFKNTVIDLLTCLDSSVETYQSCNTIKIENEKLIGYNTDCYGMFNVLTFVPENSTISILGDGSMAKMFKTHLAERAQIYSRNSGNWNDRYTISGTVINCTSYGTSIPDSPFETLPNVDLVIDLCVIDNKLKNQCKDRLIKYVSGMAFYRYQFKKQFEIYTGSSLDIEQIERL